MGKIDCDNCGKKDSVEDYDGLLHPDHMCPECEGNLWKSISEIEVKDET